MSPRQAVIAAVFVLAAALAGELFRIGATPILKGIGMVAGKLGGADLVPLGTVYFCSAVAIIISLTASRSRPRSASSSAREAGDAAAARMTSAHYPRAWLLRGQWPGADRRYLR
jgi:hypothetical protein